jgi:hypothetical protein
MVRTVAFRLLTLLALTVVATTGATAQAPAAPAAAVEAPQFVSADEHARSERTEAVDQQSRTSKPTPQQKPAPQQTAPAPTRQEEIEREQAAKVPELRPYTPTGAERIFQRVDTILEGGTLRWHPFMESAYKGGGFTLGVGHASYVSAYNYIDVRGSYSVRSYKRAEAEFVAPRIFKRRGQLSVLGGWREATQVGFYGLGMNTVKADRTNYLFQQPYGSALLTLFPARKVLMLAGGVELTQWKQKPGEGSFPSVEERYTTGTLPGLGADVTYLHTQGTVGLDWRTSPGYSRRGAFLAATLHDYRDSDEDFGFRLAEYEGIAHLPILREAWVLSFHARAQTTIDKTGQQIPFFMLPGLGGGSTLRGYSTLRFRDQNSILLQAEWRIMVNRYLDLAFFYDAGKVTARTSDLDADRLKDDYGLGLRFHGPFNTPLRVELARSRESSLTFIFSSGASF